MENQHKYSLALVGKDGTIVSVNFNNSTEHNLSDINSFVSGFNDLLALKHHLAHTPGRIDTFFKNKYAYLINDSSNGIKANSEYTIKFSQDVVRFAMDIATIIVILDEKGKIVQAILPDYSQISSKNLIAYFEKLITSKLEEKEGHDYLIGFSTCISEKLRILEQQDNTSAVLTDRLQAIKVFTDCIYLFKNDNDDTLPKATVNPEGLRLLLKKIFSTVAVTHPDVEISQDALDWDIIIAVLQYDGIVMQAKKETSPQTCADTWRETRGSVRSGPSRGKKGWSN